ncbi:hypothetical protein GGF46_004380 [Coemansia sp. RSA 552]|nr:hypothetical protein GGF46_004380 [Coemansia sp. RSA 552]
MTTEINGVDAALPALQPGAEAAASTEDTGAQAAATSDGPSAEVPRTPARAERMDSDLLSEAIAGATPGRHSEPQFKCVYPPSEDTQSLVVEHFGFLPISFIDEIINAANDTIYRATDALCKFVEDAQGGGEATSQAINKAETLLEHAVDKNFDKFELYALRNLFNIPQGLEDYMVLPHRSSDATGGPAVDAEDEDELDRELAEVRRELTANALLKARVENDVARFARAVRRLRALNEHLHLARVAQDAFQGAEPHVVASSVRAQISEITQLVEQLNTVSGSEHSAAMDVLKEPAGRDLYLAHLSDIQRANWEAQAQTS